MTAEIRHTTVQGFDALELDNGIVRAVIIPALGGRVWELWDLRRRRQWIWHREEVPLARVPLGSTYDDVWAGGWEELFPNDAPEMFEGRSLPDHGEWWTLNWTVCTTTNEQEAVVRLEATTTVRRTHAVKEFRLTAGEHSLRVSYRIHNRETEDFHFLFKQHLPIAISPACTLRLPGGRVTAVDPSFGTILAGPGPHRWPARSSSGTDLQMIPARDERAREFIYVNQLTDGWCGVDDMASGAALRMSFDRTQVPFLWMFLTYGGWRDCYTAVLEPCTNMPKTLREATALGTSARLEAGAIFATCVAVSVCGLPEGHDQ
jgi:hypothetical protein